VLEVLVLCLPGGVGVAGLDGREDLPVVPVHPEPEPGRRLVPHETLVEDAEHRSGHRLEHGVPGRDEQPHVEVPVVLEDVPDVDRARVEEGGAHLLQMGGGPPRRGQPGGRHLEQFAHLQQVAHRAAGRRGQQREAGLQVGADVAGLRVDHERAAGDASRRRHQVLAGEHPQGLAHGAAADPVQPAQLGLDRQPVPRLQLPRQDLAAQQPGEFLVRRDAGAGGLCGHRLNVALSRAKV
jgi:hypothetical protein